MKEKDDNLEQVIDRLASSTRSPRGAFSVEASRPLLEKRIAARRRQSVLRVISSVAAIALLCILSWGVYMYMAPAEILTVTTFAEIQTVELPDGTSVTLNRYTSLSYPERFKNKNREVSLQGEAYFAVSKDKEHPFIVQAGGVNVRVLGTEFNVEAYPKDNLIETSLFEGSVALDIENMNSLILVPGERAAYDRETKHLTKDKAPRLTDEILWQKGALVFNNSTLKEISRRLSNAFNVSIRIQDQSLEQAKMTARFVHNETLDDILLLLQEAGGFKVEKENQTIIILPNH